MLLVGARESPLSRAQVAEVFDALREFHSVEWDVKWVKTRGDRDRTTSLRRLEKTDFFTRELDELLLSGAIQIAIHSAKDLPEPLLNGLVVAALTRGVDQRDALVLREGMEELFPGAVVGTSSVRREEAVRQLYPDVTFLDIRGTIEERLSLLSTKQLDALVVAEAALLRLQLSPFRIYLPGPTAEGQGKLAVVCRSSDIAIRELFECLDSSISV